MPFFPLKKSIRVLNGFGKSLEVILPKLGNGYIVPDAAVGRDLALSSPDAFFLSQSGECFHNVTVTGGKQRSEGPLSMKRELRDVLRLLEELERALREKEILALTLGREIHEHTSLLDRLEDEKREAEKQAMTSGHLLQQLDGEMSRVRERMRSSSANCSGWPRSGRSRMPSSPRGKPSWRPSKKRARSSKRNLPPDTTSWPCCATSATCAAETTSQRASRVATLEERHRSATALLQRIETRGRPKCGSAQLPCRPKWNRRSPKSRDAKTKIVQLAEQLVEFEAERNAGEARDGLLQFESEQVRARLTEIEELLRTHAPATRLRPRPPRRTSRTGRQACSPTCNTSPTPASTNWASSGPCLMADTTIVPLIGRRTCGRRSGSPRDAHPPRRHGSGQHDGARRIQRNRRTPPVPRNPAQRPARCHRKHRRHHQGDRPGLAAEIRRGVPQDQRKLPGHLPQAVRRRTTAFMRLTDKENSAESGIDVVASPPGKKLQNVLLLSGGEKALTALVAAGRNLPVHSPARSAFSTKSTPRSTKPTSDASPNWCER